MLQGRDEGAYRKVLSELRRYGILLESDQKFPSAVNVIVGGEVSGSWWRHKDGLLIFRVLRRLQSDPEVLVAKLVSGKLTLIHRELWPELLAISTSEEPWQTKNLSPEARMLLRLVEANAELRTDLVRWKKIRRIGEVARELESGLLVQSEEIHTPRGSHAKILRSWKAWSKEARVSRKARVDESKRKIENLVRRLDVQLGGQHTLPWL